MKNLYKILSFILIPCAFIIAVFTLSMAVLALGNPPVLIGVFMLACVVIYTFKSIKFFNANVQKNIAAPASDKAWIRINGFISLFFAFQFIGGAVVLLQNPALINQQIAAYYSTIPATGIEMPSEETLSVWFKNVYLAMSVYALLLAVHVLLSLSLVRKYNHLFSE